MAFTGAVVAVVEAVDADLVLSAQQDLFEAPGAQPVLAEAVLALEPQPCVLLASAATCVGDTFTKVLVFGS